MRKHDKQSSRKLVLQTKNTLFDIKFDSINLVKHFLMQTGITDQTHHRCHMIIDFFHLVLYTRNSSRFTTPSS